MRDMWRPPAKNQIRLFSDFGLVLEIPRFKRKIFGEATDNEKEMNAMQPEISVIII